MTVAQIILLLDDITGTCYDLEQSPVTIGRTSDNTITIRERAISRHHAEIVQRGEEWVVRDLGSRNGVRVNDKKVKEHPLSDGDMITVGETRLRYRGETPATTPMSVKVPKDLIRIPELDDNGDSDSGISPRDSREEALARIDEISVPGAGDLSWEPITQLSPRLPLADGPGPTDSPVVDEIIVHHAADKEPLLPVGDELMAMSRPQLARRADLHQQLHASLLTSGDAGILWADALSLIRRLTDRSWAGVFMPAGEGKPLRLQLGGEGGHSAEVPRMILEAAMRSGQAIHWHGSESDPYPALAVVPWGTKRPDMGLVVAPTRPLSPAEATPLLDLIAGIAMEIGQWWPTLLQRWNSGEPKGPQPLPPLPTSPPPPL